MFCDCEISWSRIYCTESLHRSCVRRGIRHSDCKHWDFGLLVYYLAVMPRLPEPLTGRIYLAGAANNTAVFVNKSELAWLNFLHYDMTSVVGILVVLLAIFVIIPKVRREGQL